MSPGAAPRTGAVSLVVPAYNEGAILASVLSQLVESFPTAEILVVSDGSTDDTADVARSFAPSVDVIEYRPNRGKGCAVRTGMLSAGGDTLVFTDADLPFGTDGVARLLELLETRPEVDIAIAEKTGAYRDPLYRAARGVVRLGVRWSLGLDQPDTQAGLKGFRRRAAQVIFSQAVVDGFAADMEMLGIAAREGFTVASVPLEVVNDALRPSTFTPSKGIHLVRDIWGIRRRLHR
jgi:dolichyl-phosphate beta-glucosyltransferase